MGGSKLTRKLEEILHGKAHDAVVDIIVELDSPSRAAPPPSGSRAAKVTALRERFLEIAAPVEQRIQSLGGQVIEHAWLNQTLRARIPVGMVDRLVDAEGVASIDVPERITRD
jgi:hypothetical protein